jgi:hypothetical protein
MSVRGIRSIDVVVDEVRSERGAQLSHFDAIDTKAGVLLGFAGAIVALSGGSTGSLVGLGRIAAVLAGLLALGSFWPRKYWTTDLRGLRDSYLAAEPEFTRLHLVDSQIVFAERAHHTLERKALLLKGSMEALGLAILALGVGLALG